MANLVAARRAILRKYHPGALESRARYVRAVAHPEAKPPKEYWGTSSMEYGEVSTTGEVIRTPTQVAEKYAPEPKAKPAPTPLTETPYQRIQREALYTPAPPAPPTPKVERVAEPRPAVYGAAKIPPGKYITRPEEIPRLEEETAWRVGRKTKLETTPLGFLKRERQQELLRARTKYFEEGKKLYRKATEEAWNIPYAGFAVATVAATAKEIFIGIPETIVKPGETVEGLKYAAKHPMEAGAEFGKRISTERGLAEVGGEFLAWYGIAKAPSIAGRAAEAAKAAKEAAKIRIRQIRYTGKLKKPTLEVGKPFEMKVKVKDPLEYLKRKETTILPPATTGDIQYFLKTTKGFPVKPGEAKAIAGLFLIEPGMKPLVVIRKGLPPKIKARVIKHEAIHVKRELAKIAKDVWKSPGRIEEKYVTLREYLPYTFERYTAKKPAIPKYKWRKEFPIPPRIEEAFGIRGRFAVPEKVPTREAMIITPGKEAQLQLWPKRVEPLPPVTIEKPTFAPKRTYLPGEYRPPGPLEKWIPPPLTEAQLRLLRAQKFAVPPTKQIPFQPKLEKVFKWPEVPGVPYPFKERKFFPGKKARLVLEKPKIYEKYPTLITRPSVREPKPVILEEVVAPRVSPGSVVASLLGAEPVEKVGVLPKAITRKRIEAMPKALQVIKPVTRAKTIAKEQQKQRQRQKAATLQIQKTVQQQIQKQVPAVPVPTRLKIPEPKVPKIPKVPPPEKWLLPPPSARERRRKPPAPPSILVPPKPRKGYAPTLWGYYGLPKIPARKELAKMVFTGLKARPGVKFPTRKKITKKKKRKKR